MTVTHLERAKAFWAEMSAREYFVQIYQDEEVFVDWKVHDQRSADDERLFQVAIDILARATKNGRKVRAFGETVAVMWAKGFYGATVKLEYLWHQLCSEDSFALFGIAKRFWPGSARPESIATLWPRNSRTKALLRSSNPGTNSWR